MEFQFQEENGTARITGNFRFSLPLTQSKEDTVHLEYELEGW